MRVPIVDPLARGRGREAKDNLIVLQAPTSSLTLLDTDPDPFDYHYPTDLDDLDGVEHSDIGGGGADDEQSLEDNDHDFWKRLLSPDPPDSQYDHDISLHDSVSFPPVNDPSLGFELDSTEPLTIPIKFSSKRKYENLFHWDFQRYSFPSRQLNIAKAGLKPRKGGQPRKEQTEDEKGELERFKQEIRVALNRAQPPPKQPIDTAPHHVHESRKRYKEDKGEVTDCKSRQQRLEDQVVADLLGEYIQEPSFSLLDMDNETPSKSRGRGGHRWTGPVRDIETGRPVTPYKDDPDGTSIGSGASRRGTGGRGKSFPSLGSSRGRGRGGSRGPSPMPIGGIQPNVDKTNWVRAHSPVQKHHNKPYNLPPKASTQSLPSKASSSARAGPTKHTPSMPSGQARPEARPIGNVSSPYFHLISRPQARSQVPREDLQSPNQLQRSIMRSWHKTQADPETQKAIIDLLEWLSATINLALCPYRDQRRKKRRFEVDVFGSVAWGGETGSSGDLDLVVLDRDIPQGYHPDHWRVAPGDPLPAIKRSQKSYQPFTHLPAVYDIWKLSACLRQIGMRDVVGIRHASTPIIKFKSSSTGRNLDCDVNVNDLGGWYNSALILAYCEISPFVLRPLVHALKLWASAQDLNDPSGAKGPATMSSYCLTLLAIGYLQQRGHLPNLQAGINVPIPSYPTDRDDPDLIWVSWGKSQGLHAHVAFNRKPPADWVQKDKDLTAAEAVKGFFAFFSSTPATESSGPRYDRENTIISVLNGGVVPRSDKYNAPLFSTKEERMEREPFMGTGMEGIQPSNWRERSLIVQDPFIWQKSCTSAMHLKGLERWFSTVDRTYQLLRNAGDAATLDDLLIPPPAPAIDPRLTRPPGGGGGDRLQRYANRMYASRGSGRGRGGGGGGGGGGPAAPNVQGQSQNGQAGPSVEKLLEL